MTEGLDTALTQVEFGDLVGIGQLAVSDLMSRKVIGDVGACPPVTGPWESLPHTSAKRREKALADRFLKW